MRVLVSPSLMYGWRRAMRQQRGSRLKAIAYVITARDAAAPVARGSKLACSLLLLVSYMPLATFYNPHALRSAALVKPGILAIVELDKSTA